MAGHQITLRRARACSMEKSRAGRARMRLNWLPAWSRLWRSGEKWDLIGQGEVGDFADVGAGEAGRCHADDGYREAFD
jgi:hypothetical protein